MIKAGIIGGAGYTAGELIRILLHHPEAEIISVVSSSHAGKSVFAAHPDLEGETDLVFSETINSKAEVVFLCSGHGKSKAIVEGNVIPEDSKIIDLSSDYRIEDGVNDFVYGLPELNRVDIKTSVRVANPGCFATCIQLSLLPLASQGLIKDDIHISAITGSTGAGQKPIETTNFSWRSNNASVYKVFTHQHLAELNQSLNMLQADFNQEVYFVPMRGAFTRGILATSYTETDLCEEDLVKLYKTYYQDHPFIHLTESEPDVKTVVGTNKALLHVQKINGKAIITGVIDNLTKGASGQAVQNMNLMFGLKETTGLNLKSTAF